MWEALGVVVNAFSCQELQRRAVFVYRESVGVCVCGGGMKHKDCPNVFGETSEDV